MMRIALTGTMLALVFGITLEVPLLSTMAAAQPPVKMAALPEEPPIIRAARKGQEDEVRRLLEEGADPNAHEGYSALMQAIEDSDCMTRAVCESVRPAHRQIVNLLIKAGANVNYTDPDSGQRAIHRAAFAGDLVILRQLIAAGAQPNPDSNASLLEASVAGENPQLVRYVLEMNSVEVGSLEKARNTWKFWWDDVARYSADGNDMRFRRSSLQKIDALLKQAESRGRK